MNPWNVEPPADNPLDNNHVGLDPSLSEDSGEEFSGLGEDFEKITQQVLETAHNLQQQSYPLETVGPIFALEKDPITGISYADSINITSIASESPENATLENTTPVLFIPGFGGSFTEDTSSEGLNQWDTTRGLSPDQLSLEPLGQAYYDIVQSLDNVGYTPYDEALTEQENRDTGANLFTVTWDWRLPVAGVEDGSLDGTLTGVLSQFEDNNSFQSGVDYLGYWLEKVKTITGAEKVDIITHSTGGLVARSYIQSDSYGEEVNGITLPTVEDLVLVGVPNQGTSEVLNFLQDDWNSKSASRALARLVDKSYDLAITGTDITGPDVNFVWNSISQKLTLVDNETSNIIDNEVTKKEFLENYIASLNDLLPTFEFYDDTHDNLINYQSLTAGNNFDGVNANQLILDLNGNSDRNTFIDQTDKTTVVYSSELETLGLVQKREGPASINEGGFLSDEILSFTEIIGRSPDINEVWYQDLEADDQGDGTLTKESTVGQFLGDSRINGKLSINEILKADANEEDVISHTGLVQNIYAQKQVLEAIGITEIEDNDISTDLALSEIESVFKSLELGILSVDDLQDIDLEPALQSQIKQILVKWDELATELSNSTLLTTELPLLDQSLDQLLGQVLGGSNSGLDTILNLGNDAASYLDNQAIPSLFGLFEKLNQTVTNKLNGFADTIDQYTEFGPIAIDGGLDLGDKAVYIDINLDAPLTTALDFDLENSALGNAIAESLGDLVNPDFSATFNLDSSLTGTLRLGLDINDLIDDDDSTSIGVDDLFFELSDPLTVALTATVDPFSMGVDVKGLGNVGVSNGSLITTASVSLALNDVNGDGKLTLQEIQDISSNNNIKDLFEFTLNDSSVDADLPIFVDTDKIKLEGAIALNSDPLFNINDFSLNSPNVTATLTSLEVGDFLKVAGNITASANNDGLLVLSGTGINGFVGQGATTDDINDDIGLNLANAELSLTLAEDGTYTYSVNNAEVTVEGIDLFDFSGTVNATGDQDQVSLELGDLALQISDFVKIDGDFSFTASSGENGSLVEIISSGGSAFAGVGSNTVDTSDDLGLQLSNVDSIVRIDSDGIAYQAEGEVSLVGVSGFTVGGTIAAVGNTTGNDITLNNTLLSSGINQVTGTGLIFDIADLVKLTGDLTFEFRDSDPSILAAGQNLTANVDIGNDLAGTLDNGTFGLALFNDGTYALQGSGNAEVRLDLGAAGPDSDDLIFIGDLGFETNTTGQIIDETININDEAITVEFETADNVSQFNASNLDLDLSGGPLRDALLEGADLLQSMSSDLVPTYDEDGNELTSGSILTEEIPGIDVTLDEIVGVSAYLGLGDFIETYLTEDDAATLQGLMNVINTDWSATLPEPVSIESVLDSDGFNLALVADYSVNETINLGFTEEVATFGLVDLQGNANLTLGVTTGIDFDLGVDFNNNFDVDFALNRLNFDANATGNDLILGAFFGPIGLSLGSNDIGKEQGQASVSLGGSISYVNDEFNYTADPGTIDVNLPVYATIAGTDLSAGETPKVLLKGDPFGDGVEFTTENFDKIVNFKNFSVVDILFIVQDLISWAEDFKDYDFMATEIPLVDVTLGDALNFATAINNDVFSQINFYTDESAKVGQGGEIKSHVLTDKDGNFTADLVGQYIVIDNVGFFEIASVEDSETLTLIDALDDQDLPLNLTNQNYIIESSNTSEASLNNNQLTDTDGNFTDELVGQFITLNNIGTFEIASVEDAQNLTLVNAKTLDLTEQNYIIHSQITTTGGNINSQQFVDTDGGFTDDLVGKYLTIDNIGTYQILEVVDSQTLTLENPLDSQGNPLDLSEQTYIIHTDETLELIRTVEELITAVNNSGILPDGVEVTYDAEENRLAIPFTFEETLTGLDDVPLDFGLDLGDLSLSTSAATSLNASVDGRMDIVVDFDSSVTLSGTGATLNNEQLTDSDGGFTSDLVEQYVTIDGQTFQILTVTNSTTLTLDTNDQTINLTNQDYEIRDGKGISLYLDNVGLNGSVDFEVTDLEVAAELGFLGLTAGGENTGSGVNLSSTLSTGLDRDPDNETPGDTLFRLNDLLNADLVDSFNVDFAGDAAAILKGLSVDGGFGNIDIAPEAELSVYIPDFNSLSGLQVVHQPVTETFDLHQAVTEGTVTEDGFIVVLPDVSDVLNLKDLSFADIITGIRAGIDFLSESLADDPFYTTSFPIINVSLEETFTFLDDLTALLDEAANNPSGLLQEVEQTIETALGLNDDNTLDPNEQLFSLSLNGDFLDIHLGWEALLSESYDFSLDLETIKELSGNSAAAALDAIDSLADLNGGGSLLLEALAQLNFDIAVDLTSLSSGTPDISLRDYNQDTETGTFARIGARVEGTELDLNFKAGPIDIGVVDGSVVIDGDGNLETNDYAGILLAIDQQEGSIDDDGLYHVLDESVSDNLDLTFTGGFNVNLPIVLEVLGISVNLDPITIGTNPVYGDQGLFQLFKHLAGSSDAGVDDPLVMSFPDIRGAFNDLGGQFSLLSLINDPSFILDGVNLAVGSLEDIFDSSLAQDIPLLGDKLASAASFLRDMRQGLLQDLRDKLSGDGKAIEVLRQALYDVFGPDTLGLLTDGNGDQIIDLNDVLVRWFDADGMEIQDWMIGDSLPDGVDAIQFDMELGGNILGTGIDLPLDFSLPGFSLDVEGGFGLSMDWSFDFGFGLSLVDSFYLTASSDPANPELEFNVNAFLDGTPDDTTNITTFDATGELLFFQADLSDNKNSNGYTVNGIPHQNELKENVSGVYGGLSLDIVGNERDRLTLDRILSGRFSEIFDVDFGVEADLDLGVILSLDGADGLPRLGGDLALTWDWQLGQTVSSPDLSLNDLSIDLGSFVTDFLTPIANTINNTLKPVEPLIDVLDTEVPGLDLLIDDNTIKGLVNLILELKGRRPIDWTFVDEAKQMLALVDKITNDLNTTGWLQLGDIKGLGTTNVQGIQTTDPQGTPAELDSFLSNNTRQDSYANSQTSSTPRSGFQILPYIKDISNWTALLTGGDATLFTYELPLLEFGADFNILLASIGFLPKVASLNLYARGGFAATADLGFGYDTFGIRKAIETGNPLQAFDGFFVMDYNLDGEEKDEFTFNASLGLAASISLAVVEAGLEGAIVLDMGVDLQDIPKSTLIKDAEGFVIDQILETDGRIRGSEFATMFNFNGGGFANLVNLSGSVDFEASAFVDLNLLLTTKTIYKQKFLDVQLLDLTYNAPFVQPILAEQEGSTLYLNMGDRASNRVYNNEDGGEIFILSSKEDGKVGVEYDGYYQEYTGITHIIGDGGLGDDSIDASLLRNDITVELTGGLGKDILIAGVSGGLLEGGDDDDSLDGSVATSPVVLRGGTGDDQLIGGSADDTLEGEAGDDDLSAGEGDDILAGGTGDDNLDGETGDDTYEFSDSFNLDRFEDNSGNHTLDFSEVTFNLDVTVNRRGINVSYTNDDGEVVDNIEVTDSIDTLILGSGNDVVYIDDTPNPLTISTGGGDDTVTINGSSEELILNTDDDDDTVHINDNDAAITLNTGNHADTINVNSIGHSITINAGDDNDTVNLFSNPVELTINGDAGDDTINIKANQATVNVDAGTGSDTVNITDNGDISQITALVNVSGGDDLTDTDYLNIDQTANTEAHTVTLTETTITSSAMTGSVQYSRMDDVTLSLGSGNDQFTVNSTHANTTNIEMGAGEDTVTVETIAGQTHIFGQEGEDVINIKTIDADTTVDGGAGDDVINVSNDNQRIRDINAILTLEGGENEDTINIDNTQSTSSSAGTLTTNRLFGLDMGGSIAYETAETLNIDLGVGDDNFTVDSTHVNLTNITGSLGADQIFVKTIAGETHIWGQEDEDTITVSDNDNTLGGIQGSLYLQGNDTANDILIIDNSGAMTGQTGTLSHEQVTGWGMTGTLNYQTFEDVTLTLGEYQDNLTVLSTIVDQTTINTDSGLRGDTDTVKVETFDGNTSINTGDGSDQITIFDGDGDFAGINATLEVDGGQDGDIYQVTVPSTGSGTSFINLNDQGASGIDQLTYLGSSDNDLIQLDTVYDTTLDPELEFSSDRWLDYGNHGEGVLISHFDTNADAYQAVDINNPDDLTAINESGLQQGDHFQVVNYSTIDQVMLFAGAGDDKIISDDTAQEIDVFGNAGNDQFYVGSVLSTELVFVEGQEVAVVTEITHGASFEMNFYGGDDDDYFEVNHNRADIKLFGDNGDDTFFIKALLTLNEDEDLVELDNKVATVSGATGEGSEEEQKNNDTREVDVDSLVYVENANVDIDGGAGFDSVAIVGTVLSDSFYIFTEEVNGETVQRIYGAGVKLRELVNIERIQLITGAGDDRVYLYGVDLGPGADFVLNTGTGSDTIFVGGEALDINLNFPKSSRTEYATVDGYQGSDEIEIDFSLTVDLTETLDRVVPFNVEEPSQTVMQHIPAALTLDGIVSPVLINDAEGLIDTIIFNNQEGPENLIFEDQILVKKSIETDKTFLTYPDTSVNNGTTTDLIAQLDSLADDTTVVETVDEYLRNQIIFTDRYFDTELINRLIDPDHEESEIFTIEEGVSYAAFQDTLDENDEVVTALEQLKEFLTGTGYEINLQETDNPDPSQTDPLLDIISISNGVQSLAFEGQYREITKDNEVLRDIIGVSLLTSSTIDFTLEKGYVIADSVEVVDEEIFHSLAEKDQHPLIYLQSGTTEEVFEEITINLNTITANNLVLNNEVFSGKVFVNGSEENDTFNINQIGGQTFINAKEGDDTFEVGEGTVTEINSDLFLRGDEGNDTVIINSQNLEEDSDILLEKNTVINTFEQDKLSKVTNALEFTNITETENELMGEGLEDESFVYVQEMVENADINDLKQVAIQGANELGEEIENTLTIASNNFDQGVANIITEQQNILTSVLEESLVDYYDARKAQEAEEANYQALITERDNNVDAVNNIISTIKSNIVQREDKSFLDNILGGIFDQDKTATYTVISELNSEDILNGYNATNNTLQVTVTVEEVRKTRTCVLFVCNTDTDTREFQETYSFDLSLSDNSSLRSSVETIQEAEDASQISQEQIALFQQQKLRAVSLLQGDENYFTDTELDAFYAQGTNSNDPDATAVIWVDNDDTVQTRLTTISEEINETAKATQDVFTNTIEEANQLAILETDISNAIAELESQLTTLNTTLETESLDVNSNEWERWVHLQGLEALQDILLTDEQTELNDIQSLWDSIPAAINWTSPDNWTDALTLFNNNPEIVEIYKQAQAIAENFTNYQGGLDDNGQAVDIYADFRAVYRNILKFETAKTYLENGFNFDTFKADYEANIAQLNTVLDDLDNLKLEAQYTAQLASLQADQEELSTIVNSNAAVLAFFEDLQTEANNELTTIENALAAAYTFTINWFFFRSRSITVTLDYSNDPKLKQAQTNQTIAATNYQNALEESQTAIEHKAALDTSIAEINEQLENLPDSNALEELYDTLDQQYKFLRNLSRVAIQTLSDTRADQAAAGFDDASSLIAEVQHYLNNYTVSTEIVEPSNTQEFKSGPSSNSVITETRITDGFEVLSLTGFNQGGIHADYNNIEQLTVYTGNGADTVNIHDSLGQSSSEVVVITGAGDDSITLSNDIAPIDPLSTDELSVDDYIGDVKIDAGTGNNQLVINDQGDTTGDTIVQQYTDEYVQITGMAQGDIYYVANGGDFAKGLDITTSSGVDQITIEALHGEDHTQFNSGAGNDNILVKSFVSDPSAKLTIDAGIGNDVIDATQSSIGVNIFANGGQDSIYGSDLDDLLNGGAGEDTLIGNIGNDTLDGGEGVDLVTYEASPDTVVINLDQTQSYSNQGGVALETMFPEHPLVTTDIETTFTVNAGEGQDGFGHFDQLSNVENVIGSAYDDVLIGNEANNTLSGGDGDDVLIGNEGNDTLEGEQGQDTVSYRRDPLAVTVDLTLNQAQDGFNTIDTLADIENVIGSQFDDQLKGDDKVNVLMGEAGKDIIQGEDGHDLLFGNGDEDTLKGGLGNDLLLGGEDNDELDGEDGNDGIQGNGGDDLIISSAGDDSFDGGEDADTVSYFHDPNSVRIDLGLGTATDGYGNNDALTNIENVIGSQFGDVILGNAEDNDITGGAGEDTLRGNAGNDTLRGNAGNDVLDGGEGADTVAYETSPDTVVVNLDQTQGYSNEQGLSHETIFLDHPLVTTDLESTFSVNAEEGQDGFGSLDQFISIENAIGSAYDDVLIGDEYDNALSGGDGDDLLIGNQGNDTLDGQQGQDTVSYRRSPSAVTVDLSLNQAQDGFNTIDTLTEVENVIGSQFDDEIKGDDQANVLMGEEGQDTLEGGDANDVLFGNGDEDILKGGLGDDFLVGGDDNDELDGGDGKDTASYFTSSSRVYVNLKTGQGRWGDAYQDNFELIENIEGSLFNDQLRGDDDNNNILSGLDGNDSLWGYDGDDEIHGGDGSDRLYGNEGHDLINGGDGSDRLYGYHGDDHMNGGQGDDSLYGHDGNDLVNGDDGNDLLYGNEDHDIINGGQGDDSLYGNEGHDLINGEAGDDTLYGNDGNDTLNGNDGNDHIQGHDGDDLINGGQGDDYISGNNDNDTINGDEGHDDISGSYGDDEINGGSGNDNLSGGAGHDRLRGNDGNDTVSGGTGDDTLEGHLGDDFLFGNSGDDYHLGGLGNDSLDDWTGTNRFIVTTLGESDIIGHFHFSSNTLEMEEEINLDEIEVLHENGDTLVFYQSELIAVLPNIELLKESIFTGLD